MSPRHLRTALVHSRLDEIRSLLDDLDRLGIVTVEDLTTDRFRRHVTERVLSAMVDLAVGVNSHVLATRGRVPADAASTFTAMAGAGVLADRLAEDLVGSVGLRNAIVHEYADVNLGFVAAAVPMARRRYGEYVRQVAAWTAANGSPGG
ncbi:MAG: DUF86 domain-containing protein [Kineosporiaceae bacterium]